MCKKKITFRTKICIFIPIMSEMYGKTYRFRKVSCAFVMLTTFAITRTQATHRLPAIRIGCTMLSSHLLPLDGVDLAVTESLLPMNLAGG